MRGARCEHCNRLTHRRFMAIDGTGDMVCGSCYCHKVKYRNRAQAERARQRINEQHPENRPSWSYHCPRCNRFHLTTQPQITESKSA